MHETVAKPIQRISLRLRILSHTMLAEIGSFASSLRLT